MIYAVTQADIFAAKSLRENILAEMFLAYKDHGINSVQFREKSRKLGDIEGWIYVAEKFGEVSKQAA